MKFENKLKVAAGAIILVMSTVAALPMFVNQQVTTVIAELRAASAIERLQMTLLEQLLNAETAQRGFVITGEERFLAPYHAAVNAIPATQEALRHQLTSPEELARAAAIERAAAVKMETVARIVALRRNQGFDAAAAFINTGNGKV